MLGQFAPLVGAVCVPLPPAAGADAAGAGLAALTIATPPTAIIPPDSNVVAMILRAPENSRLAAGASGCWTVGWLSFVSMMVPYLFLLTLT
jgi:hypothetical protein